MSAKVTARLVPVLVVGALAICVVPAQAQFQVICWDVQQKYHNDCEETFTDLLKVLSPEVTITAAIHDKFQDHIWWTEDGYTYILWYNGEVAPCEETWACFDFQGADEIHVHAAYWSQEETETTDAGAPLGGVVYISPTVVPGHVGFTVEVDNSWTSQFSGSGYILATSVQWAMVEEAYPLELLNDELFVNPSITWYSLPYFGLDYGETIAFDLGAHPFFMFLPEDQYVLFAFETEFDSGRRILRSSEIWQIPTIVPAEPGVNPEAVLAMHTIVSDEYLYCDDVCPATCAEIDNSALMEEIQPGGYGYCFVVFSCYNYAEISGVEFRVTGWPTGPGIPPPPPMEFCPLDAWVWGNPWGDGCFVNLNTAVSNPEGDCRGMFCFAWSVLNMHSMESYLPLTISYIPSSQFEPTGNKVVEGPPWHWFNLVAAEHGATIGGQHWEDTPYDDCVNSPTAMEATSWGGVKALFR